MNYTDFPDKATFITAFLIFNKNHNELLQAVKKEKAIDIESALQEIYSLRLVIAELKDGAIHWDIDNILNYLVQVNDLYYNTLSAYREHSDYSGRKYVHSKPRKFGDFIDLINCSSAYIDPNAFYFDDLEEEEDKDEDNFFDDDDDDSDEEDNNDDDDDEDDEEYEDEDQEEDEDDEEDDSDYDFDEELERIKKEYGLNL